MPGLTKVINCLLLIIHESYGQSMSFQPYMNPVIPGDYQDITITKIGNNYYTTGTSFYVTPVSYHSADFVLLDANTQPVSF